MYEKEKLLREAAERKYRELSELVRPLLDSIAGMSGPMQSLNETLREIEADNRRPENQPASAASGS